MTTTTHTVGVISDTHGLLRTEALAALEGADLIVHAGDIGDPAILEELAEVAPTHAVRGNNDREAWAADVPRTAAIRVGDALLYMVHEARHLRSCPAPEGVAAVITGHSHRPLVETRDGVLYVNPGSAGPRRFKLPIALARLTVSGSTVEAEILRLDAECARR